MYSQILRGSSTTDAAKAIRLDATPSRLSGTRSKVSPDAIMSSYLSRWRDDI
jgi:hypothetical protein